MVQERLPGVDVIGEEDHAGRRPPHSFSQLLRPSLPSYLRGQKSWTISAKVKWGRYRLWPCWSSFPCLCLVSERRAWACPKRN
jgi:hypothetical protein